MSRHRFAVALLAPPEQAAEIDVLRRALGVAEPFHVAPHVTLVPPTNVAASEVPAAMEVLRRVAGACRPMTLDIGPVTTFAPETPTVHLAVGGDDVDALRSLRGQLRAGPFDRPDVWPFHPHVTLREGAPDEVISAAMVALASVGQRWRISSVHLLEQHRRGPDHPDHGQAYWVPVREEPLGGPSVVGRGGVELMLRTVGIVEPDVARCLGVELSLPAAGASSETLVVVAEGADDAGAALGVAVGRVAVGGVGADLHAVVVDSGRRGIGIGSHLLRAWCGAAADRGADLAGAVCGDADAGFLLRHGFIDCSGRLLRRL